MTAQVFVTARGGGHCSKGINPDRNLDYEREGTGVGGGGAWRWLVAATAGK